MSDRRTARVAALATDAVPLVGVGFLGWSLPALVVVYWVELGVGLGFAALRAAFARRPPEHDADLLLLGAFRHKRGGLSIPRTDLGIQLANLPILVVLCPVFGAVWFLTGGIALGGLDAAIAGEAFGRRVASTAALGIVGIVVGRGIETATEYFLAGRYESVSVQGALQSAIWPILIVGLALVASGVAATSGAPPVTVLVALVCAKSLFDLADACRDRLVAFDRRSSVDIGWANDPDDWSTVETGLREPIDVVRSRRLPLFVDGVVRGCRTGGNYLVVLLVGASLLFGLLGRSAELVLYGGGLALALLAFLAGCGVVDRLVRYLSMEYRVGRDAVGYDRVIGRPQWRVPGEKLEDCDPQRTVADRLFGTWTLTVDYDGRPVRIPHVSDEGVAVLRGEHVR